MAKAKRRTKSKGGSDAEFTQAARMYVLGLDDKQSDLAMERMYGVGALPCPLLLEYQLGCTGIQFGLIYQFTGDRGSMKTTLMFEMMRIAAQRDSANYFILTEGKFSPSLSQAILGYSDEDPRATLPVYKSEHMQDWQQKALSQIKLFKQVMDKGYVNSDGKKFGPQDTFPFFVGVDSAVGQLLESQHAEIEKSGGQPRGYATHVKALGEFVATAQAAISNRPIIMNLINHCSFEEGMFTKKVKEKGGNKLAYNSSSILVCSASKAQQKLYKVDGWGLEQTVQTLYLECNKSSIGADFRAISVPVVTRHEIIAPGETRQRSVFRWGQALVNFILARCYQEFNKPNDGFKIPKEFQLASARQAVRDKLFGVTDFKKTAKAGYFECKKYEDETGCVFSSEILGRKLSADPDYVNAFREAFGIIPVPLWPPGMPWPEFAEYCRKQRYDRSLKIPTKLEE